MGSKRVCPDANNSVKSKKAKTLDFLAHPRRKIAIQFFYLGWEHDGLVQQPHTQNTVENHIMQALIKTHLIEDWTKCDFSRCGRTDKGVSAFKQTAAMVVRSLCPGDSGVFWSDSTQEHQKVDYKASGEELPYVKMLNGVLPKTIRVFAWAPVAQTFNARFDCNRRTYKYSFAKADLNLEKMRQGAELLVGEHDFSNFCQIDMNEKRLLQSYVRKVYEVKVEQVSTHPENDMYSMVELTVSGSGFLWHMIRYIVTILQEIGRENEQPSLISQLLDLKKYPSRPQYTLASDTPLCLFDCGYKSEDVEWKVHDYTLKSTVTGLQKTWATYQARSRMMENMLGELTGMAEFSSGDANKGLHEFVQDRPIPSNYIRFENRKMCESLESKKEKMAEKKKNGEESSDKL
ncbi:putative tRNA pseudouridine synthase tag-124 [Caenorhabditis elegans]|uniref:Probable tRNA pseudouridine synthase tag-124 n=1 Tax=Caenorhabditis elegans TaxID=6239 RepID=TG124_CAEEL|nr:putative tRNA pseudouridine synthase tag-124 [Caenorhabditis elegans]Q09524.1 RecName: Full=Probable tRNA pseudouridine synthase tag-124; AltName: Full=tRNA pseudouridylate synthase; AltName: Full=tRNA-uridine isomerase [Caenorhabditis elegans]CAA87378.1 Probable tRNA pseudouridine synthase tag-124 [Caenorhabditis elegans]|eukprot:NP_496062.3 Probable tRNA pseudouridine synthase tag-124 [Caenorhabditis elegans]